ncbi:DUF4397 domain-containing protein [Natrinema amylolyticum]|uniref:DUF4397 domain-containing protein n=1 Tax=Natrinema amylolyticum TaxID=2878679 RepID=UPI001CF9E9D0|nr:DUF4397 domain-containing protein [Natrinema amylolyticum]
MVQNHTRRRALAAIGTASGIALAGCMGGGGDEDEEMSDDSGNGMSDGGADDGGMEGDETDDDMAESMANVRVAHLSPDAPNVDVYVGGDPVLEDVPYRDVSDYLELEPDTYEVMITAAGDADTVVFDEELEIPEGEFTIAALGELSEENQPFEPAVLEDDVSDPGDDARVRLVHASPDAPAVDVTVGDGETVLFEGAEFGDAATTEVPGDEYALEVRPATENYDGDIVGTFDVAPEGGSVYTAFAVGYLEPGSAPADEAFDLEVVMDN